MYSGLVPSRRRRLGTTPGPRPRLHPPPSFSSSPLPSTTAAVPAPTRGICSDGHSPFSRSGNPPHLRRLSHSSATTSPSPPLPPTKAAVPVPTRGICPDGHIPLSRSGNPPRLRRLSHSARHAYRYRLDEMFRAVPSVFLTVYGLEEKRRCGRMKLSQTVCYAFVNNSSRSGISFSGCVQPSCEHALRR